MKFEPIFTWNEETGESTCTLTDYKTGKKYVGKAMCHPDDVDMMSEKTGSELAFRRAEVNALRGLRDEVKSELNALNKLYNNVKTSSKHSPYGYETIMLKRHIKMTEEELATIKTLITEESAAIRELIDIKENFYNRVRLRRMAKAQQSLLFNS